MRLKTAETYLGLLGDGLAPMSYAQGAQVRLTAYYEGIGPVFKIKLELSNLSPKPITNVFITLNFKENIYKMNQRGPVLPIMLPLVTYKVDLDVENIDPTGANDVIRVYVVDKKSTVPLITANLNMPVSEVIVE